MVIEDVRLVIELKHNLLRINQSYDKWYIITFDKDICSEILDNNLALLENLKKNIYTFTQESLCSTKSCLVFAQKVRSLQLSIARKDLVKGLPNIKFEQEKLFECRSTKKKIRTSFKSYLEVSTT